MTARTIPATAYAAEIGPRVPGGRYRSYYWQQGYNVLRVVPERADGMPWSVTVRWDDGRVGTHCLAWDPNRDAGPRRPVRGAAAETGDGVMRGSPDETDPKVAAAKPAASRAPYQDAPARPREVLDPQRPWLEAGRSHLAAADRLLAESRRTGGALARWQTPAAVTAALRDRAKAATASAKLLAPLTATGWVVLHDRVLAGTSAVLDHVLVGPVGIVVVQDRPTRQVGVDQAGTLWADGVPLHAEREQLRWAMLEVLNRSVKVLGEGWYVYAYPFLVLHTASPWRRTCASRPAW